MDEWLDSLSEDWVSQPRSQHLSSILQQSSAPSSNGSQSRIPRYMSGTASRLSSGGTRRDGSSSNLSTRSQKDILKARTQSELNTPRKRTPTPNGRGKVGSPARSTKHRPKGHDSPRSKPPTLQGTVQHKASPSKDQYKKATPEWKKRIVQGEVGKNTQTDLFSPRPVGLESVFKPPTVSSPSPQKGIGKTKKTQVEDAMSAPLHKPSEACQSSTTRIGDLVKAPPEVELPKENSESRIGSPVPDDEFNKGEISANASASDQSKSDKFTPVYISRRNTADGRVNYTAVDISMQRLRSNMDYLRLQSLRRPSSRSTCIDGGRSDVSSSKDSVLSKQMDETTSHSLPDDLSIGTDAFAANGGFVNVKRGGLSNEGSFYRRTLSPSSSLNLDDPSRKRPASQEVSASQERTNDLEQQKAPSSPKTPLKNNQRTQGSPEQPRSSGSPLKLFDKYDTFTNDKLIRRMSKFEETFGQNVHEQTSAGSNDILTSPSPRPKVLRLQRSWTQKGEHWNGIRVNSFGGGELDAYSFSDPGDHEPALPELPRMTSEQIRAEVPARRGPHKRSFRLSQSANKPYFAHQTIKGSEGRTPLDSGPAYDDQGFEQPYIQSELRHTLSGKRLPLCQSNEPIPKKRRTIDSSEERGVEECDIHDDGEISKVMSKPLVGRKRKDALYDNEQQAADPRILAMRQIRRPRNPTPNQASSSAKKTPIDSTKPDAWVDVDEDAKVKMDPPTQIVAGALATVALTTAQDMSCGPRKASVTTADFFSEAQQIMQLIRAERRPRSSQTTADASTVEPQTIQEESVGADSTRDDFSRPPSREGGSLGKLRVPTQLDARVISHLRKFEDKDDLGLALSSSLKSFRMNHSRSTSDSSIVHKRGPTADSGHETDPPNIRILERQMDSQRRERSPASHAYKSRDEKANTDSNFSYFPSTRRSIPTGSSGSSSNKMVIAPETVAHLLSDQMAGMVFDHQKQMWTKRKGSVNTESLDPGDGAASEDSEEDLFGDIPDLSVDEMEELKRVQEAVSVANTIDQVSQRDLAPHHSHTVQPRDIDGPLERARPKTAEGKSIGPAEDSSAPSKYSHFASSGLIPSTRATSWGDEYWPQKPQAMQVPNLPAVNENSTPNHGEEVEHEISILEGRGADARSEQGHRKNQARVVTVAFSSPLVDQMQPPDLDEGLSQDGDPHFDDSPRQYIPKRPASTRTRMSVGFGRKPGSRYVSRRRSFGDQSHVARPMSRLDEHEEMSIVQYSVKGNRTMDISISTPLPLSRSPLAPPATCQHSSVGFHLSPLPDFTVNQIDRPVDAKPDTIARVSASKCITGPDYKLSLTAQDLVKHLTDLEPFEPYWEYIRSVNLRNRGLTSLHLLDEFCSKAEELDVSNNQIGELNGIPSTVRLLDIRANCLSDLAAWHNLRHLQYLDVSGNNLTNLKGLHALVHLRALRADNNSLDSLDGIEDLNGLLSLRLRQNRLRIVDFKHYDLRRLTDLDMLGNDLQQVSSVERLPALKTLNLSHNGLEAFVLSCHLGCLENLNLADNNISSIDVCWMPVLRTLILDRNAIKHVNNLSELDLLQTLSWREQRCESESHYLLSHEAHHLLLTRNVLTIIAPPTPFFNLQMLELACTGLQTLSPDFGTKCPNLRIINFNYNALRDLRPLLGIAKLRRLYLAGNRITRLRRTTAVLGRLNKELKEVDLRNNPLTVGFYTPQDSSRQEEKRMVVKKGGQLLVVSDHQNEDYILKSARAYLLPPLDTESDYSSRERLDEDTKLRRRVYEMLIVNSCKGLESLDGLEVERTMVGRRDGVWARLCELGVLKAKEV